MRVLLVDDDIEIGEITRRYLNPYEIHQAQTINEANTVLDREYFQVILIDIGLPDGSGFDLCSAISSDPKYQSVPLIILTSRDQSSEIVFGLSCGADDYVTKPFHGAVLRARIDAKLRKVCPGAKFWKAPFASKSM